VCGNCAYYLVQTWPASHKDHANCPHTGHQRCHQLTIPNDAATTSTIFQIEYPRRRRPCTPPPLCSGQVHRRSRCLCRGASRRHSSDAFLWHPAKASLMDHCAGYTSTQPQKSVEAVFTPPPHTSTPGCWRPIQAVPRSGRPHLHLHLFVKFMIIRKFGSLRIVAVGKIK
jgi:hypothetical protein